MSTEEEIIEIQKHIMKKINNFRHEYTTLSRENKSAIFILF